LKLEYYTDGECNAKPSQGAWAFICKNPYHEQSGSEVSTTENRMKLIAVLNAIEHGIQMIPESIVVFSDSTYVCDGFNSWMSKWEKSGWKIGRGGPVKNPDIWIKLFKYRKIVTMQWINSHHGNEYKELVDQLVHSEFERTFSKQILPGSTPENVIEAENNEESYKNHNIKVTINNQLFKTSKPPKIRLANQTGSVKQILSDGYLLIHFPQLKIYDLKKRTSQDLEWYVHKTDLQEIPPFSD
jgi:ribonuclease HI